MKNIRNILLIMICFSLVFMVSCEKEEKATTPQSEELQCDANCGTDAVLKLAEREIVFGEVPSTIIVEMDLVDDADVNISVRDCCIRDDVVEIYVDGCLIGTVDSRGGDPNTHEAVIFTVSLVKGMHTVTYVNTLSTTGPSGWVVSELEFPYTGMGDCDGDGILYLCDDDDDNDGVLDEDDMYPCSDTSPTIIIDMCDTYVINQVFPDGTTMMDLINVCAAEAINHGEFVSCVSHMTNEWKSDGLISGKEKGKITDCAANAMIP